MSDSNVVKANILTAEQLLSLDPQALKVLLAGMGADALGRIADSVKAVAEERKAMMTAEARQVFQDSLRTSVKFPSIDMAVCQAAKDRGAMSINVIYDLSTGIGTPSAIYPSAAKAKAGGVRVVAHPHEGPQRDLKGSYDAHATAAEKAADKAEADKKLANAKGGKDQTGNIWFNIYSSWWDKHPQFHQFKNRGVKEVEQKS